MPHTWPAWSFHEGLAPLARYVSPDAVRDAALEGAEPPADVARDPRARARWIAEDRYAQLAGKEIAYARDPWPGVGRSVQQIRDPRSLLRGKVGTCLDLVTAHAAMCLIAHAAPLLAVAAGHAFLVVDLQGPPTDDFDTPPPPPGCSPVAPGSLDAGRVGVHRVDRPEALLGADGGTRFLPIDTVGVALPAVAFADAVERGRDILRGEEVFLLDVAWLHTRGYPALTAPEGRPSIRPFGLEGRAAFTEYATHAPLLESLAGRTGVSAVVGDPGGGKSTLARELASREPSGAAWFLDASEPQALIGSLARAERAERNEPEDGLDPQARDGYAMAALGRLRESEEPWVVVLDNANGDPSPLLRWIPQRRAGADQHVLITSTNERWTELPEVRDEPLPRLRPSDLAPVTGDERTTALVAGRPLLLAAAQRLAHRTGVATTDVLVPVAELPATQDAGAAALWSGVRGALAPGGSVAPAGPAEVLASLAALLPPDHLPTGLLERLAGAPDGTARRLADLGLLELEPGAREARLHRLFGDAIRADVDRRTPDLARQLARRIAGDDEALTLVEVHADAAATKRLVGLLRTQEEPAAGPDRARALPLFAVAARLELRGDTRSSAELYALAEQHLDRDDREDLPLLAECWIGQARLTNQQHTEDEALVAEAIELTHDARDALRSIGRAADTGKHIAMEGLLRQKQARFVEAREEELAILLEANVLLEEADALRTAGLPVVHPERARSRYNLAGIRVRLAQVQPEEAAGHLEVADDVYREVGDIRRAIYAPPSLPGVGVEGHPHIAACTHGLGIVAYYRALLVPAAREERTAWLRDATSLVSRALVQREAFEGATDEAEAQKGTDLLAKIALARSAGAPAQAESRFDEILEKTREELRGAGLLLPSAPRLTADADVSATIDAWTTAPALRALVEGFGARLPDPALPVGERLALLDGISERWDYRQQAKDRDATSTGERNVAVDPTLTREQARLVEAASVALGLQEILPPARAEYDHVVVLGGLARAGLARPLHAAKLLADGTVRTGSVTALGSFHALDAPGRALTAKIVGDVGDSEFDAMRAGTRAAFGLGEPESWDGDEEDGERLWRIERFRGPDGVPVQVLAAPVPPDRPEPSPGIRPRPSTVDACRWLAEIGGTFSPGQSVLVVTTYHYRLFQLAAAIRTWGLPLGLRVDAVGMRPGAIDPRLVWTAKPRDLLQETRSTIRELRQLHGALPGTPVDG